MIRLPRGVIGDDIADDGFRFTNTRRRSNSSSVSHLADFKTKFDINEEEPVFEESLHGPLDDDMDDNGDALSKTDSSDSGHSA